jgi:hypothetical protein
MKGTTTGADLSEEVIKVLQSLDITIQELVTYGVPSIVGKNQRCEEYNESRFDKMPLPYTPRKSVHKIAQNAECCCAVSKLVNFVT